uniref:Uncharacterized protein n=1 Tax=Amazona collaria TaxID=241587 RepID=A0A8B9FY57_9PSIT
MCSFRSGYSDRSRFCLIPWNNVLWNVAAPAANTVLRTGSTIYCISLKLQEVKGLATDGDVFAAQLLVSALLRTSLMSTSNQGACIYTGSQT